MTSEMIMPNSVQDTIAESRHEHSESSEFQQFEFWVNGVKRIIKIPMHSEVEPNFEASSTVVNVEPGDVDELHSCSVSADPIVIDPDLNDSDMPCVNLSHKESLQNNFVSLESVGHVQNDRSTVAQNVLRDVGQNSINPGSVISTKVTCQKKNTRTLTVKESLKESLVNRRLHHSPKQDMATCVNQSIASQLTSRTAIPVLHSHVQNSLPLLNELLDPSTVLDNISQPVDRTSNSKFTLIPPVYSGIPGIRTKRASRPPVTIPIPVLPSSIPNGSATYIMQQQWKLNKVTSANCSSSTGALQAALTEQVASQQGSFLLLNKQSHDLVPPQSISGANRSLNLSQFLALNGQGYNAATASSSLGPVSLDCSSANVRKVKISTDVNGSCVISVDGQPNRSTNSPYIDKQTNISTTGGAVPYVVQNGITFQIMHPNAIQNSQMLQFMPSDGRTLHYLPSNALGCHRPVNVLPNDNAFCLKPPNYRASGMPPSSFASPNVGLIGFEPSCTKQASLAVMGRANVVQQISGAVCVGSVGMGSLCRMPSSLSTNMPEPVQSIVKCSSVACSASFSMNSSAVPGTFSSSDASSIPSASLTSTCLPWAIPITSVNTYRNAVSIPLVKDTTNTTGSSCNRTILLLRQPENQFFAPFQPPVTESSNVQKSAVPEASHNLVMPSVKRILHKNFRYRENNPLTTGSKSSPTYVSYADADITTPSASDIKSVSSFLVSSAPVQESLTFPPWSSSAVRKTKDSLMPCRASMLSSGEHTVVNVEGTWYPPKSIPQISSARAQNYSSKGDTVPSYVPAKVLPALAPTVSCCPQNTSSHLTLSVALKSAQTLPITKSSFSFYNSTSKHPVCKSVEKPIPSSSNLPGNTSVNSEFAISECSSLNNSDIQTDIASPLIPLSIEPYHSSVVPANVSRKRKCESSNGMRRNESFDTSTSSLSDTINLFSDPESSISSSESGALDDSMTTGKSQTRRRCRKVTKQNFLGRNQYSPCSLDNSEIACNSVDLQCFVSLENLYLNGKMSVDIRYSSESLVCCKCPTQRTTSEAYSLKQNVSRKKSYKLETAVNYISDTD